MTKRKMAGIDLATNQFGNLEGLLSDGLDKICAQKVKLDEATVNRFKAGALSVYCLVIVISVTLWVVVRNSLKKHMKLMYSSSYDIALVLGFLLNFASLVCNSVSMMVDPEPIQNVEKEFQTAHSYVAYNTVALFTGIFSIGILIYFLKGKQKHHSAFVATTPFVVLCCTFGLAFVLPIVWTSKAEWAFIMRHFKTSMFSVALGTLLTTLIIFWNIFEKLIQEDESAEERT